MRVPGARSGRVRNRFAGRIAGVAVFGLWMSFVAALNYTIWAMNPPTASQTGKLPTAYALYLKEKVGPGQFPSKESWEQAPALRFSSDWRGQEADPQRETDVRLLWTRDTLFLRFHARYRELYVFPDARQDGWRDQLWDRDVAEAFLQPDADDPLAYKEFEVSPNGYWIDLTISHRKTEQMRSGLRRHVVQDAQAHTWTAELAIPMSSLMRSFNPKKDWRVNFYRVEGKAEPRFYSAWSPTMTPQPNFHVPEAFGHLVFRENTE
jgi:alpha-galactosidase